MNQPLVLSLFPGIGLLDRAFEEEGFCVVRGPDVLWGGDIRRFHPPAGVFDGVIGGPPCQSFSSLVPLLRAQGKEPAFGNLIPEFERCVAEAAPRWFLMENVLSAPLPDVRRYHVHSQVLNNRWVGGEQQRRRRISFSVRLEQIALSIEVVALESAMKYRMENGVASEADRFVVTAGTKPYGRESRSGSAYRREATQAVTAAHQGEHHHDSGGPVSRYTLADAVRLQGLPEGFLGEAPFTAHGKLKAVANGVPLPMGRAIARAVKRAMGYELEATA